MSSTFTSSALNDAANGLDVGNLSLHTGNPGDGSANEISGGGYTRKAAAFPAAVNGGRTVTAIPFDIPAGTTITHLCVWSVDGLTLKEVVAYDTPETYANAGIFNVTHTVKAQNMA